MKSKFFNLDINDSGWNLASKSNSKKIELRIQTLDAYAIESSELKLYGIFDNGIIHLHEDVHYQIKQDRIIIDKVIIGLIKQIQLHINYQGIYDYKLLFPSVAEQQLKERLSQYYIELESAFESQAWLSFSLMAGAIFEGMLTCVLDKKDTFHNLIFSASENDLLTEDEVKIIDKSRKDRNLVHSNNSLGNYPSRQDAMRIKAVLDKLIVQLQDKF